MSRTPSIRPSSLSIALPLVGLGMTLLATPAIAAEQGEAVHPEVPWAVVVDDGEPSLLERATGVNVPPEDRIEPYFIDGMLYDADSLNVDSLTAMGLPPQTAVDFDPTPGVLYVEMNGVTLEPDCDGPQAANGALNCSPLVKQKTVFPAYGTSQSKAAVFQKLSNYYNAFNLVLSTNRPPAYLPYTMAVIGGTSGNAGLGNGTCGVANVACDGAKRNHVSLSFPDSCGGSVAEIAAQETAHNWGLEHTVVKTDLMYPFVTGGTGSFRDECMDISHATGNGVTQCTYVHKSYCPGGGGEAQNSYAELLGVFGARQADDEAPQILAIEPADGAVFSTEDTFGVNVDLADNSNFLGVRWTWSEGVPEELGGKTYTRCTNQVCDADYKAWKSVDSGWEFLVLTKPPAGAYTFTIEAMDAYGNSVSQTVSVDVVEAETTSGGSDSDGSDSDSDSGSTGGTSGDGSTGGSSDGSTGGTSDGSGDGSGDPSGDPTLSGGDDATASATTGSMDDDSGCRIGDPPPFAALGLLALGFVRRRRRS